ncbi:hypothetical protein ACQBAT_06690 [Ornithinimicrobium sp. Y1847]|uniref:hypothetical protein n=1 Tax=Ornithinimicrobium sp. Y1847 TaxID=3405419 RepID=UPI003B677F51
MNAQHAPTQPDPKAGRLTPVLTAYGTARGDRGDQLWAERALATFVLENARDAVIERELSTALELVQESGESAQELFGPAAEWARERLVSLDDSGRPTLLSTAEASWREAPLIGLVMASLVSLVFLVLMLLDSGLTSEFTWGLLLAPGVIGVLGMLTYTVWQRTLTRHRRVVAGLATGVALVVTAAAAAGLMVGTSEAVVFTGSTFWLVAVVVGYLVLAWASAKMLPARDEGREGGPDALGLPDEAWVRELAGTLRLRMEMPERRIDEIVREARGHAAQAGVSLAEEFGTPSSYASRFPRDRAASSRRMMWFQLLLVPLGAVVAFAGLFETPSTGVAWQGLLMMAVGLIAAWMARRESVTRRSGEAGREAPGRDG